MKLIILSPLLLLLFACTDSNTPQPDPPIPIRSPIEGPSPTSSPVIPDPSCSTNPKCKK